MRKNTKGKRFLALVLAAVLMLSVCPVTASAEDNLTCTKNADCEADTHFTDCPKYVAAEGCIKNDNCEAEAHVEGCPKLVTVKECTGDNNCEAETHVEGCPKLVTVKECTGDDDCEAETHVEGCPKLVTVKECTGDDDCEAETHAEGCPKFVTVKECTGDDDCEAETHTEDCPKYVAEKDTEAREPEEVSDTVKAFLDAVAAIVLPEEINEETGPVLNEQIGAAQKAYGALSEEELAREDVQAAAVKMQEAINFLTGGIQTLDDEPVAQIDETTYNTLNEALAAAADGDTIKLLSDCELVATAGVKVNSDIIIQGTGSEKITVTAEKLPGDRMIEIKTGNINKGLTLKDCNVDISNIPASGYGYNAVIIINGGKLVMDNCDMTIDGIQGDGSYNNMHGFWCLEGGDNLLSVVNGSNLVVKNFDHNAIEWDGTTHYYFEVKYSTYTADHTRGGIIGTWDVTFDNAVVNVINSSTNGSNGSNYTIIDSIVNYNDNGAHGLSTGDVVIKDSLITCKGNKYTGFHVAGSLDASTTGTGKYKTRIDVTGNSWNTWANDLFAGLRLIGNATVGNGVTVNVSDNYGVGIRASDSNATYTFENGVGLTVAANGKVIANGTQYNTTGGGIWNRGTMTIPTDAIIYNNHATTAGDDIYNTGTITFGKVGSDWALDGAPDCTDDIDGWYYDGYALDADDNVVSTRWNAHSAPYVHEYTDFTGNVTNAKGTLALKAAHGLETNPDIQPSGPAPDWGNSKSKTATNLDKNFESKVTLSLPAASYKGNLDVAFVLDGSTSADQAGLAEQAASLLNELAEMENLNVKASLTVFGGSVPILEDTGLLDISDVTNLTELTNKLTDSSYDKKEGRSGSNLQAGVEAANAKLTADNGVDSADKYLIILSDGAARMWYKNGSAMSQAYNPNGTIFWNSNEDFIHRYGTNAGETGKLPLRSFNDVWTAGQSGAYIGRYGMTEAEKNAADKNMVASWETVAKDPDYYTTYEAATYYAAGSIIKASQNSHVIFVSYPYHSGKTYGTYTESFKAWLASNNYVTRYDGDAMGSASVFDAVKKDLIQVVDAGSKVVDVIGYGDDYDFQFVNDIKALTMTVGGKELAVSEIDNTTYGFGWNGKGYDFVLHYYPNGNGDVSDEHFVWDINVPVTKDETVQLTYTVKLTDPKTEVGTYGQYDADGSKWYKELYTNNSATLYPVDSNGNEGDPQDFPKPTVSYTVEKTDPEPSKPTEPDPTVPDPTDPEPEWGKLTIDKSANRTTVRPGKTITYTIKVTNRTGEDLEEIVVSENLDANLTFVSASGDGNYAVKDGLWTISELKNGKTAKLTIKATVKSGVKNGTVIKNTVVITEAGGDPVPGTPSDTVKVTVSNKISLIPQTGDTSNIGLWIGVLVACAVVLGVVLILTVKKKKTR